jgi:hypothetical protein
MLNRRDDVLDKCRAFWESADNDMEVFLRLMRAAGFSKADSIRALVVFHNAKIADAKTLVHNSQAWCDRAQADDAFHDEIIRDLLGKDEPNSGG